MKYLVIFTVSFLLACKNQDHQIDFNNDRDLVQFVNPLIGSESTMELSHGNTYPAIALPHGMCFWTPQTAPMG
ncbi:MAG: hypothetical protein ACOCVN_01970, partial [bacterium]